MPETESFPSDERENTTVAIRLLYIGALVFALAPFIGSLVGGWVGMSQGRLIGSDVQVIANDYIRFFKNAGIACFSVGAVERFTQAIRFRS